jgi:hypothetical protein
VLHTPDIGKAQVDELDLIVLDQLFNIVRRHLGTSGWI